MKYKITTDDRPGNMESVYENINTHEEAKILKYNDKYKTLMLTDINKSTITTITYGTFKRQWREK